MSAVTNGAELVKRLAATGTGKAKLDPAREYLTFVNRVEKRIPTAEEVIEAMEEHEAWPEMTLTKARQIAETGKWEGPKEEAVVPVEDLLLAGGSVPEEVVPVVEAMQEKFAPTPPVRKTQELEKVKKKPGRPKGPSAVRKWGGPKPTTKTVEAPTTPELPPIASESTVQE